MAAGPNTKPTLATIAEAVGVSRATVSNAFNRPGKLSPARRAAILETAERLGYSGPDPMAAGLRRGRVGVVGVIVPDRLSYAFSDPAVVAMLDGLAEVLDDAGIAILLLSGGHGHRAPAPSAVLNAAVDGFALYGGVEDAELSAALQRRRLPVVAMGAGSARRRLHVDLEEEAGSRAMAGHLLGLGHRRFGVVTLRTRNDGVSGPMAPERRRTIAYDPTRRRLESTLATLAARGIDPDTVPIFEVDHNHPSEGAVGTRWLLAQRRPPTAIIAQSDQIALGVLDALAERAVRVPAEVSVGGFDDIDVAARTSPPLTTVRQPLRDRGRASARLLLRALAGEKPRSTILPTELVVRASTGRAPNSRSTAAARTSRARP